MNESAKILFWTTAGWSEIFSLPTRSTLAKDKDSWQRWSSCLETNAGILTEARAQSSLRIGELVDIGSKFLGNLD